MQLDGIKNIIFDLGGVIINLDEEATTNAFKQLFPENFEELHNYLITNNVLLNFETGKITSEDFINVFMQFDSNQKAHKIINACNSMLLNIPTERIFLLRKLSRKYRVFLLSNTNQIHLKFIDELVKNDFGFNNLAALFEKAYYSHILGLRKPNPQTFLTIVSNNNLKPEETLFIDDSEQHILAAKQLNLKTHHLKSNQDIVTLFNENK